MSLPPALPPSRIRVEPLGEWVLVDFVDAKALDGHHVQSIGDELFELTERYHLVVLNFASVASLSAAMLGKLIALQRRVVQRGGQLALCAVNSDIQELIRLAKLDKHMQILASVAEAPSPLSLNPRFDP
jgi:anti-anti-sigma factor